MDLTNLKFAALLHDIGKFYQATGKKYSENFDNVIENTLKQINCNNINKNKYEDLAIVNNGVIEGNDSVVDNEVAIENNTLNIFEGELIGENNYIKWSVDFVNKYWNEDIQNLVLSQVNPKLSKYPNLAKILNDVDFHEDNFVEVKERQNFLKYPLVSIFSKFQFKEECSDKLNEELNYANINKSNEYYHPLNELKLNQNAFDDLKPVIDKSGFSWNLESELNLLWFNFISELIDLDSKYHYDFNLILALFKKYTSNLSDNIYCSKNDISFYEHTKITVALANCKFLFLKDLCSKSGDNYNLNYNTWSKEGFSLESSFLDDDVYSDEKPYLIVKGTIYGIQNFIFDVFSYESVESSLSQLLRGKSLFISFILNSIVHRLIEDLNLSDANIIFKGEGKFILIAPNTDKVKKDFGNIKNKLNDYFLRFTEDLYFDLKFEECFGLDLFNFNKISDILNNDEVDNLEEYMNYKNNIKNSKNSKNSYSEIRDNFKDNPSKNSKNSYSEIRDNFKDNPSKKQELNNFNISDTSKYCNNFLSTGLCFACGKSFEKLNDELICPDCKNYEFLAEKVANSDYLIRVYSKKNHDFVFYNDVLNIGLLFEKIAINEDEEDNEFDLSYNSEFISKINKLAKISEKIEIIKLNDTDFLDLANLIDDDLKDKVSFNFSFIPNNLPEYSEDIPLSFENLAKVSRGADKLGVLRIDVDNLTKLFAKGFNSERGEKFNLSRFSMLSSSLNLFFSGFINSIANNYKVYKEPGYNIDDFKEITLHCSESSYFSKEDKKSFKVYKKKYGVKLDSYDEELLNNSAISTIFINYSEGDDLLAIGPYDDIIEFAQEVHNKFNDWVAYNSDITLSAGIYVISSNYSIPKAAFVSEKCLDLSKSCGKNKITLFGEVINWEDAGLIKGFNEIMNFAFELEKLVNNGKMSKSSIYSMLHMWQTCYNGSINNLNSPDDWNNEMNQRLKDDEFIPLFKYKLRLIEDIDVWELLNKKAIDFMPWIKIPVTWVTLRTRECID